MVSKNHQRLRECVDVAELLSDPNKVVEDDTCLERILSAVEEILTASLAVESDEIDASSFMAVFELPCSSILTTPQKYASSSVNYLLKLRALFLTHMKGFTTHQWAKEILFLIRFSKQSCREEDGKEILPSQWFLASVQSSWLSSIVTLISNPASLLELAQHLNVSTLATLTESRSIFVRKQACNCIAKYAIGLKKLPVTPSQSLSHETIDMLQNVIADVGRVIMNQCSLKDCFEICKDMLDLDHMYGTEVLTSLSFVTFVCCNEEELKRVCKKAEPWFAHFICSLYQEPMMRCLSIDYILPSTMAFEFAFSTVLNNPTKNIGWNMLSSVLLYGHDLPPQVLTTGRDMLHFPIWALLGDEEQTSVERDGLKNWPSVVSDLVADRERLGWMFRNCSQAIAKLWQSGRFEFHGLRDQMLSILESIPATADTGESELQHVNSCVKDNWKLADSTLSAISSCFNKFSVENLASRLQNVVIASLSNQNLDHAVVQKCNNLVLKLIAENSDIEFLQKYLLSCSRKLSDWRWEVRDTTLEFLAKFFSAVADSSDFRQEDIEKMFTESSLPSEVLNLVRDSNSYVRSSAVELTRVIVSRFNVFDCKLKSDIMSLMTNIVLKEREAIPRRSAVQCLHACFKKSRSATMTLLASLHCGKDHGCSSLNSDQHNSAGAMLAPVLNHILYDDLDWEVKFNAVDVLVFLIRFHHDANNSNEVMSSVGMKHLTTMLTRMLDDCDSAVRDKAYKVCYELNSAGVVSIHADELAEKSANHSEDELERTLIDLDNLLEEVLLLLRREKQSRLTHGCHGPSMSRFEDVYDFDDDSITMDCY